MQKVHHMNLRIRLLKNSEVGNAAIVARKMIYLPTWLVVARDKFMAGWLAAIT